MVINGSNTFIISTHRQYLAAIQLANIFLKVLFKQPYMGYYIGELKIIK